jgi:trigger factor
MKIKLDKNVKLTRKFKIVISKAEVADQIQKQAEKQAPKIKMDGFRIGKVPLEIIKKNYASSFFKDAISNFIEDARKNILDENKFSLASAPSFEEIGELKTDSDIQFYLNFELWPEIPEIKYNKISVIQPLVKMNDKELDEQLSIMSDRFAELQLIEDVNHKTVLKNVVDIDYSGKVDGMLFEGGTAQNQQLELGSGTFIPGFEEQLIGFLVGNETIVKVKFPDEYHSEKLAGKNAEFDVKINKIYTKISPKIDDDLAKKFDSDSIIALTNKIKTRATEEYINATKSILKSRVIDLIAKDYDFDLPESVLKKEIEARKQTLIKQNEEKSEKEKLSEKEIDKKSVTDSEIILRSAYLKNYWIEQYKVSVTEDDFKKALMEETFRNGGDYKQMLDIYTQYPKLKQYLVSAIEEQKIFDNIFPLLKIKEKDMTKADADLYLEKLKADENLL